MMQPRYWRSYHHEHKVRQHERELRLLTSIFELMIEKNPEHHDQTTHREEANELGFTWHEPHEETSNRKICNDARVKSADDIFRVAHV
jgi:hypothetical protein